MFLKNVSFRFSVYISMFIWIGELTQIFNDKCCDIVNQQQGFLTIFIKIIKESFFMAQILDSLMKKTETEIS